MSWNASWKALFEHLTSTMPELQQFRGYSQMCRHNDAALACIKQVTNLPHSAALVMMGGYQLKIIHHFHEDVKSPVLSEGTDQVWALCGNGAMAAPVNVPTQMWSRVSCITPSFASINGAKDEAELKALPIPMAAETTDNPKLKFHQHRVVVLPPLLVKALMEADTEEPYLLLVAACKALVDYETQAAVTETHAAAIVDDQAEDAPQTATEEFFHVVQALYLAVRKPSTSKAFDHHVDPLSTTRPTNWAYALAKTYHVAECGGSDPIAGGGALETAQQSTAAMNLFTAVMEKQNSLLEARAQKDSKATKTGQGKFPPFVLKMMFNAMEPLPMDAVNDNGDPVTQHTKVTKQYQQLLESTTVGNFRSNLTHYVNNVKNCNAYIPLSTANALYQGHLKWLSIDRPEAFSVFACCHLASEAFLSINPDDDDQMSMHLRVSEGEGLNQSDVDKLTKVVHYVTMNMDTLAKQFSIWSCLCSILFGEKSDVCHEINSLLDHMERHQTTYVNMQRHDQLFCAKLGSNVDRRIQLYLMECADAASPDEVTAAHLSLTQVKLGIVHNTFDYKVLPDAILCQVSPKKTKARQQIADSSSDDDGPVRKPKARGRGRKVSNPNHNAKWRVSIKAIGWFVTRLSREGPKWQGRTGMCFKYHSQGECTDDCKFHKTHGDMPSGLTLEYGSWISKAKKAYAKLSSSEEGDGSPKKQAKNNDEEKSESA